MRFKRRLPQDDEAVPMASMADIAFLLVIFFMLAGTLADKGLVIELPETAVRETLDVAEVVLTIAEDGTIHAGDGILSLERVGPYVREARRLNPRRPVVVRSDRRVPYGAVADVMDELLQAGVRDVALPTASEEGSPGG